MRRLGGYDPEAVNRAVAWFEEMAETAEDVPVYVCRDCRDTAYVPGPKVRKHGMVYDTAMPCPSCDAGYKVARGREMAKLERQVEDARDRQKAAQQRAELGKLADYVKRGKDVPPAPAREDDDAPF